MASKYIIYEYARERNYVNMSKLMGYVSRSNRKKQVEQIIRAIFLLERDPIYGVNAYITPKREGAKVLKNRSG